MTRLGLLAASALLGALLGGCSNECQTAFDCPAKEVCYKAVCTPAQASYASCDSDSDCNPSGVALMECIASTCRLRTGTVVTDAGQIDSGMTPDTGVDSGVDSGVDAGITDTGTSSTADAG